MRRRPGPSGPVSGLADRLDGDLLERDAGDVLGPEHVADLGSPGMIICAGPSLPASQVPSLVDDDAVLEVGDVLAEVPDRSVVGLRVEVVGDLLDAPVEVGGVLRDQRLDPLAAPRR